MSNAANITFICQGVYEKEWDSLLPLTYTTVDSGLTYTLIIQFIRHRNVFCCGEVTKTLLLSRQQYHNFKEGVEWKSLTDTNTNTKNVE